MKITIRPFFGKIKNFASEYTKAFASIFGGFITLIVSAIMEFHSLAQLDIICVNPIWGPLPFNSVHYITGLPLLHFSDNYFADGPLFSPMFGYNLGRAYDFFLGMNAIAWGTAIIGTFLIMLGIILFYRANMLEAKEILENNGLNKPLFPQKP